MFYRHFKWQAQNPVTYQSWTNYNYGQSSMTVFEERTRSATYGKDISLKDTNAINIVKNSSANTIYPLKNHCTLLLVSNLAYPQWVSVDCSKPILHHIICLVNETRRALRNNEENTNFLSCSNMTVKRNNRCYMFKWFDGASKSSGSFCEKCKIHKMKPVSITDLQMFNFVLEATSFVRFKFLSELSMNSVNMFSYEKIWLQVTHASQIVDKKFASHYYICYGKTEYMKIDQQFLYKCNNNIFISTLHVCDRSSNCEYNKSDKMECSCKGFNKHCREICNCAVPFEFLLVGRQTSRESGEIPPDQPIRDQCESAWWTTSSRKWSTVKKFI